MLLDLKKEQVEFLVVGAYCVAIHGIPRATKDIDIWIRAEPKNAHRTLRALARFGAPLKDLTAEDLSTPGCFYQIGLAPARIDILTKVSGLDFEEAWTRRHRSKIEDIEVDTLSRADLIAAKQAAGRPQDFADIARLTEPPPPAVREPASRYAAGRPKKTVPAKKDVRTGSSKPVRKRKTKRR